MAEYNPFVDNWENAGQREESMISLDAIELTLFFANGIKSFFSPEGYRSYLLNDGVNVFLTQTTQPCK